MQSEKFNIGVDVGGTTISTGIVNEKGEILVKSLMKTDPDRGSDNILLGIIQNIKLLLQDSKLTLSDVNSIGIGIPGTTDTKNGIVIFAPNIFWKNVLVSEVISNAFKVPVHIVQDSRAAAWGEYLVGSGKGYKNISCITLGTGIGCGMIIDGKIFHGGLNTAGEFGHQIVELNGYKCNCGKFGCLEAYTAGLAIIRDGMKIPDVSKLIQKDLIDISVKDVYSLAKAGNSDAINITEKVVRYLGMGFVNLINLNSLELISISGGISNASDELLFDPLRKFVQERAYSAISDKIKIVKSILGDSAPLIGSALLYKNA